MVELRPQVNPSLPPSSSGPGRGPLKAKTGVRNPVGALKKSAINGRFLVTNFSKKEIQRLVRILTSFYINRQIENIARRPNLWTTRHIVEYLASYRPDKYYKLAQKIFSKNKVFITGKTPKERKLSKSRYPSILCLTL